MLLNALVNDLSQLLLPYEEVYLVFHEVFGLASVHITQILTNGSVKDDASYGGVDEHTALFAVPLTLTAHLYLCMEAYDLCFIGHDSLVRISEYLAFAGFTVLVEGQVI